MNLKTSLDALTMERAVLGGAVLGCGGGGKLEDGLILGERAAAHGRARLIDPNTLSKPLNAAVVMPVHTSGIDTRQIHPLQAHRAVETLQDKLETTVTGLVNGGLGAVDTIIGWELSGYLGIPLLNVGIPGRFHPNPLCNLLEFWRETAAAQHFTVCLASQSKGRDKHRDVVWQGQPAELLYRLAQFPDGQIRSYVAAAGPISPAKLPVGNARHQVARALQVGQVILDANVDGMEDVSVAVQTTLSTRLSLFATVTGITWHGQGQDAFGHIDIRDIANRHLQLTYGQRYRKLTIDGRQEAAFPDLIITLGTLGTPLTGEEVFMGQDLYLMVAPNSGK